MQALQHYNEAVQDLQQALKLEPSSKAFAKELDTVRKDCAEARKQRAVLKQLNGNSNLSSQLNTAATPSDAAGSIANPHRNSPPSRAGTKTATSGQSASHPAEPKNGIAYSGNAAAQSRSAVQIADANQSAAQLNTTDQPVQSTSAVKADMQPAESAVRQGMQPVQSASFSLTTAQPQTGSKAASNLARMETLVLVLQTASRCSTPLQGLLACTHTPKFACKL